jgi:hypothetical protein
MRVGMLKNATIAWSNQLLKILSSGGTAPSIYGSSSF